MDFNIYNTPTQLESFMCIINNHNALVLLYMRSQILCVALAFQRRSYRIKSKYWIFRDE